jgi:hypothetical protein
MTTRETFIEATAKAAAERLPYSNVIMACGQTATGAQVAIIQGRTEQSLPPVKVVLEANAHSDDDVIQVSDGCSWRDVTGFAPKDNGYLYAATRYEQPIINYEDAGVAPFGQYAIV